MAFENTVRLDIGLEIRNAYIRIDSIGGYKGSLDMTVNTYVSRDGFLNGSSFMQQKNVQFTPSVAIGSENFIKQGYDHLKTLPEFENAINVPYDGGPD